MEKKVEERVAKSATQHTVMGTEKLYGIAISNYLIVCGPFPLLIHNTGNYDNIILYLCFLGLKTFVFHWMVSLTGRWFFFLLLK